MDNIYIFAFREAFLGFVMTQNSHDTSPLFLGFPLVIMVLITFTSPQRRDYDVRNKRLYVLIVSHLHHI